jgi:hypothetical protein
MASFQEIFDSLLQTAAMFVYFKFYHEVHEDHEVKNSKDFALIFVQLRALCGE